MARGVTTCESDTVPYRTIVIANDEYFTFAAINQSTSFALSRA